MKEFGIFECRDPGYWDGRDSSTTKEERISELPGMTMSGARLDGRDDTEFEHQHIKKEKLSITNRRCIKCKGELKRITITVTKSQSKRSNPKNVFYCRKCDIYYGK